MKTSHPVIPLFHLFLLSVLAGCSTTIVHLHANGVPDADKESIRSGLEAKGFSVMERENEAPLKDNAIFYSPYKGLEKDLHAIENVLANNGLTAGRSFAIQTDHVGQHEYTARNIGLYIVPSVQAAPAETTSRVRAVFPITITGAEFASTDCSTKYGYQFHDNNTLSVDDFSQALHETEIATPNWEFAVDDIVVITHDNEQFKYRKTEVHREHSNEQSRHVITYNIWLQPIEYYREPFGCTYKSTYREAH